jgi:hypothetical protein
LKPNIIGIVGVIIAFISLALPWWTMTMSVSAMSYSYSASIYTYQGTTVIAAGTSLAAQLDTWYGWAALALIIVGGLLGVAGSLIQRARTILALGGVLALLSIIVFAAGLQNELSNTLVGAGWPTLGLFSSITLSRFNYTTYLSFGFWLALAGAIIMLAASLRKPHVVSVAPPTPAHAFANQSIDFSWMATRGTQHYHHRQWC